MKLVNQKFEKWKKEFLKSGNELVNKISINPFNKFDWNLMQLRIQETESVWNQYPKIIF